jgi:CyaY protein
MDDPTFHAAVSKLFRVLVKACDEADPDRLECDATADMVTVTSPTTGEKVIVNTQRAVHQLWVAGKGEGVHFSPGADGRWLDDRGQDKELLAWVAECVESATGERLTLPPTP